jgi:hypothetical protein
MLESLPANAVILENFFGLSGWIGDFSLGYGLLGGGFLGSFLHAYRACFCLTPPQ